MGFMNMREMYKKINTVQPKTKLEKYAVQQMLELFPEEPITGFYASNEDAGYQKAYDIYCPDIDFDDAHHYGRWLEDQGVKEPTEQDHCMLKFEKIQFIDNFGFLEQTKPIL